MDLENSVLILGKIYLWDCRRNDNKPSITHFNQILKNKYDTEKLSQKNETSIDLLKTIGIFMKDVFCIFNVEL